MEKTLRVGLYARVSTHDQQTLPMQLSAMREYVDRRSWTVGLEVSEVGSGAKERDKREELLKPYPQLIGHRVYLLFDWFSFRNHTVAALVNPIGLFTHCPGHYPQLLTDATRCGTSG